MFTGNSAGKRQRVSLIDISKRYRPGTIYPGLLDNLYWILKRFRGSRFLDYSFDSLNVSLKFDLINRRVQSPARWKRL